MRKKGIVAKIDKTNYLSSKAFFNMVLVGWIIAMIALYVVYHHAEKDIARQIERNDMEKGSDIENR